MTSARRHANGLAASSAAWLVLALSLSSALAADTIEINGSVAYREATAEKGPWGEDLSEFNKQVTRYPTAIGIHPFSWYNVSTDPVALQPIDGWSWNLSVKADMPVDGKAYTAGKLTFETPRKLLKEDGSGLNVHDGWSLCLLHWDLGGGERYNNDLRTDRGLCGQALGDKCMTALQDRARRPFSQGKPCECPRADDVPECADGPWNSGCRALEFGTEELRSLANGRVDVHAFGSEQKYDADDLTVYNDLGSIAWPVMAVLVGGDYEKDGGSMSTTNSFCIRAKTGVRGWETPASNGTEFTEADKQKDGEASEADQDGGEIQEGTASGTEIRALSTVLFGVGCLIWNLLV